MPRKGQGRITGRTVTKEIPQPAGGVRLETFVPWTLVKRGVKKRIVTPIETPAAFRVAAVQRPQEAATETPAVRALGLAYYWQHLLDTGKVGSLKEIAAAEGMDLGHVSRIARLAQRVPWVVEACLKGEYDGFHKSTLHRLVIEAEWRRGLLGPYHHGTIADPGPPRSTQLVFAVLSLLACRGPSLPIHY